MHVSNYCDAYTLLLEQSIELVIILLFLNKFILCFYINRGIQYCFRFHKDCF